MSSVASLNVLCAIVAASRRRLAAARERTPLAALERAAAQRVPRGSLFLDVLRGEQTTSRFRVIAECKRRSPSRGVLRAVYDPAAIARSYAEGGAAAISVLTEPCFFDGDLSHLTAVREAAAAPVLRKDFIVDAYQLHEARAAGADAVLLIVAALAPGELRSLHAGAEALGLAVLVEAHTRDEVLLAADAGARAIGVNNRDLRTLRVDLRTSEELASAIPRGCVAVAESGLRGPADLQRLAALGYHAFLVGERFMSEDAPGAALAALVTSPLAAQENAP